LWFEGKTNPSAYTEIASDVIKKMGGQDCYDTLQRGFFDLNNLMYDAQKWNDLTNIFSLCPNSTISKPSEL
jgi:hypothetical protein